MKELNRKLGSMAYDGLITDTTPPTTVRGGLITQEAESEATYKRGTLLGFKSGSEDKLVIMAEGGDVTPTCVLCDDVTVGTSGDEPVDVYTSGCFDPQKLITKDGYALTAKDVDTLRMRNIYLKAASPAWDAAAVE